jgi:hypothetical protein
MVHDITGTIGSSIAATETTLGAVIIAAGTSITGTTPTIDTIAIIEPETSSLVSLMSI